MNRIFKTGKFLLALVSAAILATGCDTTSDLDLSPIDSPEAPAGCPAVEFYPTNPTSLEIDPANPMFELAIQRAATDAASYDIKVLENESNAFSVPSSVTFAAGETITHIIVKINDGAPTATPLKLSLTFDEANINPYTSGYKSYSPSVTVIKWNNLGTGQWLDGFWYGFWDEVEIFERDDQRGTYRIRNPYTNALVDAYGEVKATYTDYFVFYCDKNDYVSWDECLYINTFSEGNGGEIKGYLPSALSGSLAPSDKLSTAVRDDDGNILYFQITPYWYMDGIGGWGTKYPCFLAFPGVDLATEWEW